MSNTEHYALEERVKAHIETMPQDKLRQLLVKIIDDGSVNTLREIAAVLRIK